jgi:hypothetical protein
MTEAKWLACTDPIILAEFMQDRVSNRGMRLFAAACCRRLWPQLSGESRRVVEVAEQYADGTAGVGERQAARALRSEGTGDAATRAAVAESNDAMLAAAPLAQGAVADIVGEDAHQTMLARDIFGNPFRPVAFDPRWRTTDVIGLARGIYDERAFDRLPLLADALMDAGCADEQVIGHCRSEGPHVRGCWVVDLVLGKE